MSKIREIGDDWLEYAKDYMKIKFNSNGNLPLDKPLKFYDMTKKSEKAPFIKAKQ